MSVANKLTAGWLLESLRAICGEDPLKYRASWLPHLVHGEKLLEKQGRLVLFVLVWCEHLAFVKIDQEWRNMS